MEIIEMDGHKFCGWAGSRGDESWGRKDIDYVINDMKTYKTLWEPNTTALVKSILKEGDTAMDVGTSVGYFTLLFSRLVGPTGRVISVEPNPTRFEYMLKNAELNGYKDRVIGHNNAAWHKRDRVAMPPQHKVFISEAITLDEIIETDKIDKIDLLKIDTDGNELKVLSGLANSFEKGKINKMVFEYGPEYIKQQDESPEGVMALLNRYFTHKIIEGDYGEARGLWNLICEKK